MDNLLTMIEAAQHKGVSREALYYAIRVGQIKAVKKYGKTLIEVQELDKYTPRNYRERMNGTKPSDRVEMPTPMD